MICSKARIAAIRTRGSSWSRDVMSLGTADSSPVRAASVIAPSRDAGSGESHPVGSDTHPAVRLNKARRTPVRTAQSYPTRHGACSYTPPSP